MFLPGEEGSRHEEAVQTPEVQPPEGGEAREEGQQRGLGDAAAGQGQALQPWSQASPHLERDATFKERQSEMKIGEAEQLGDSAERKQWKWDVGHRFYSNPHFRRGSPSSFYQF